eukprot:TRINITY_DN88210_c0_g1_i1.p1 TRINITY_DN88210_c0_g1~~TRINITY_DN88210_c0_g1_i1.p1  ORF type:complete len:1032 (-),score=197.83 TRINITY_DN88210_c0_g1_i1:3673-6768(-)
MLLQTIQLRYKTIYTSCIQISKNFHLNLMYFILAKKIQNTFELAEVLTQQNKILIEKLREQHALLHSQSPEVFRLIKENESHLQSIETLAKQVELYKSKSSIEVDKKISMLDTKAKQEARKLRDETQRLNEMVKFKDKKIKELTQEIGRLKIVIRAETDMGKLMPPGSLASSLEPTPLERRIDEFANKGKVEYRILINPESTQTASQGLNRILNLNFPSLTQTLTAQSKMLDECIQQVEIAKREGLKRSVVGDTELTQALDEYKEKYNAVNKKLSEITKQRNELESKINETLAVENIMGKRFKELVAVVEELLETSPSIHAVDISKKVDDLKRTWKKEDKLESARTLPSTAKQAWELPKELEIPEAESDREEALSEVSEFSSFEDIHKLIQRKMEAGKILKAGNLWQKLDYAIPDLSEAALIEAFKWLQIICKARDKQIQNLEKQTKREKVLKGCVELKNEEILELMTDYEEMKSKYIFETTVTHNELEEQIKELKVKIQEAEGELEKKEILLLDKEEEIRLLQGNVKALNANVGTAETTRGGDSRLREKIMELEAKITQKAKKGTTPTLKEKEKSPPKLDAILLENVQNRTLIREILNKREGGNETALVKKLYEEKMELIDQLISFSKESDQLKEIVNSLREEHSKSLQQLNQSLELLGRIRDSMELRHVAPKDLVGCAKYELEVAKEISKFAEEIGLITSVVKRGGEGMAGSGAKRLVDLRNASAKIHKEYFADEKLSGVTTEKLLDRIRKKNEQFKKLFDLYGRSSALNDMLILENSKLHNLLKKHKIEVKEDIVAAPFLELKANNHSQPSEFKTSTFLNEKVKYLEQLLADSREEQDKLKELIGEKDKAISKLNETLLGKEQVVNENTNKEEEYKIAQLNFKCKQLEEELAQAHELHFQYEKQKEEVAAQYNTIEALNAKIARLEGTLKKKQDECQRYKRHLRVDLGTEEKEAKIQSLEANLSQLNALKEKLQVLRDIVHNKEGKVAAEDDLSTLFEFIEVITQNDKYRNQKNQLRKGRSKEGLTRN